MSEGKRPDIFDAIVAGEIDDPLAIECARYALALECAVKVFRIAFIAALERLGCECRTRGTMCGPCYEREKVTDAAYAQIPAPQKESR